MILRQTSMPVLVSSACTALLKAAEPRKSMTCNNTCSLHTQYCSALRATKASADVQSLLLCKRRLTAASAAATLTAINRNNPCDAKTTRQFCRFVAMHFRSFATLDSNICALVGLAAAIVCLPGLPELQACDQTGTQPMVLMKNEKEALMMPVYAGAASCGRRACMCNVGRCNAV